MPKLSRGLIFARQPSGDTIVPALFITATGTDVGKTFVTTGLVRALRQHGRKVTALKPIATGFDDKNFAASDAALLRRSVRARRRS